MCFGFSTTADAVCRINQPILCRCANHLFLEEYFLLFIEKPYRVGDLSPIFLKGHLCRQMHTHTLTDYHFFIFFLLFWHLLFLFLTCSLSTHHCALCFCWFIMPLFTPFCNVSTFLLLLLLQSFDCRQKILRNAASECAQRLIMNYWVKRSVCTSEVKYFPLFSFICSVLKSTHLLFMRWCGLCASEGVNEWVKRKFVCGMQRIQWTDSHWKNAYALRR